MTEFNSLSFTIPYDYSSKKKFFSSISYDDVLNDPNGFNYQTILVLKETQEGKNLSKKYDSLEEMYKDMGL
ncbi:MAG: hypothetical protein IJF87_08810 [Erysipelotrichaceae bacterium]|nr:hypothetical protein [Erysipelotrichaceae bacterium]